MINASFLTDRVNISHRVTEFENPHFRVHYGILGNYFLTKPYKTLKMKLNKLISLNICPFYIKFIKVENKMLYCINKGHSSLWSWNMDLIAGRCNIHVFKNSRKEIVERNFFTSARKERMKNRIQLLVVRTL